MAIMSTCKLAKNNTNTHPPSGKNREALCNRSSKSVMLLFFFLSAGVPRLSIYCLKSKIIFQFLPFYLP